MSMNWFTNWREGPVEMLPFRHRGRHFGHLLWHFATINDNGEKCLYSSLSMTLSLVALSTGILFPCIITCKFPAQRRCAWEIQQFTKEWRCAHLEVCDFWVQPTEDCTKERTKEHTQKLDQVSPIRYANSRGAADSGHPYHTHHQQCCWLTYLDRQWARLYGLRTSWPGQCHHIVAPKESNTPLLKPFAKATM